MLNAIVPSASTSLKNPSEQQYLKGQHLGSGHCGDVYQVVEKATKDIFACKEIPKRDPKHPFDVQAVRLICHLRFLPFLCTKPGATRRLPCVSGWQLVRRRFTPCSFLASTSI